MPGSVWGEREEKRRKKPRNDEKTGRKSGKRKEIAPARERSGAKKHKMNKLRPAGHPYIRDDCKMSVIVFSQLSEIKGLRREKDAKK